MQADEIRKKFLDYFNSKGHEIVPSSSLIPHDDPTLLFANAGMNQFKNVFLGIENRSYTKAASSQKCVRAGGKHNDLENVGYTARHHTFFEMLGNFSFGDYFKYDAIKLAWEFLTQELNVSPDKLYVTVYHTDNVAYNIWHDEIKLSPEHIIKIGDKPDGGSDNFWQMGDTGPCGPCTEIFYDHGASIAGGLPGTADEDGDRYVEIWNCVFMEYNRDEHGILHPLPKPSVDTGMGLERIAAVMQNVHSNYAIDIFTKLISQAATIVGANDLTNPSLKVLADHIRSISFLIADGALPSNEGRGYVLRRIIRRAIRHGYQLGQRKAFLYKLVDKLVDLMGGAYPELAKNQSQIKQTILQEEGKFFQTIEHGMNILISELKHIKQNGVLPGDIAFKLYDTYGFPLDLTADICKEQQILIDAAGFDSAMIKQKDLARASGKFKMHAMLDYNGVDNKFVGYDNVTISATVVGLFKDNQPVVHLESGDAGVIILDTTVFYAESGGQVGDTGVIEIEGGATCLFTVEDTHKVNPQVFGHIGKVASGTIKLGDEVSATIDLHKRLATARNHSVTHLLHKALHSVLGEHAVQKGSLVCSDYTRFDFAHDKALSQKQIMEIEHIVNYAILQNYTVTTDVMTYDEAITYGAMALFDEKYETDVRVIKMGHFSTELCGGSHVNLTGDIGCFIIKSEAGVANGVRRIEAITGEAALAYIQHNRTILDTLRECTKAQSHENIIEKVDNISQENKQLIKNLSEIKEQLVTFQADNFLTKAVTIKDETKLIILQLKDYEVKSLLLLTEQLKNKLVNGIVVIGCINQDKINLVVGVSKNITKSYKAGDIVNRLATLVGGKGGGRPDLAQAGGIYLDKLPQALEEIKQYIINL